MNWSVTTQTYSGGAGWLTATPASGSSDAQAGPTAPVTVSVNSCGLAAGQYYGLVQISADGAANSPQSVAVLFNVVAAGQQGSSPQTDQSGLIVVGQQSGAPNPPPQQISLYNVSGAASSYTSTTSTDDGQGWLTQSPASGTLATGSPTQLSIQANLTGLDPGVRTGEVRVAFSDGTVQTISVASIVTPPDATTAGSASKIDRAAGNGCQPKGLVLVFASPQSDFNATVGQQISIRVQSKDDCGNAMVGGSTQVSFSNGDRSFYLVHQGGGLWTGTWIPGSGKTGQMSIRATAFWGVPSGAVLPGQKDLFLTVQTPLARSAAAPSVIGLASAQSSGQVVPGNWVSVFGEQLAIDPAASDQPYPAQLNGTQLFLGSMALRLQYVSDTKLNALIPYGLAPNTSHHLLIQRGTTVSVPVDVTVADLQPGIFTVNQDGTGQGSIVNQVTQMLADPTAPVTVGDTLLIYCTGLGEVNNPPEGGMPAQTSPPSDAQVTPGVTIGGVAAQVTFAGLTPGFIGLYQIIAQVPAGVPPGDAVPVVLTVPNWVSNAATIAVR